MLAATWYVRLGDKVVGPISEAELRDLALHGSVAAQTLVSSDGINWIEAVAVSGIVFGSGLPPSVAPAFTVAGQGDKPTSKAPKSFSEKNLWAVVGCVVFWVLVVPLCWLIWKSFAAIILWIAVGTAIGLSAAAAAMAKKDDKVRFGFGAGLCVVIALFAWRSISSAPSIRSPDGSGESSPAATGKVAIARATVDPRIETVNYCKAVAEADKAVGLTKPFSRFDDFGRCCEDLAVRLNKINTSKVDRVFVDWTAKYTNLLLEMGECCAVMSQRRTPDHRGLRLIESFVRGANGDPLGVAIEEMAADEREKLVLKAFGSQRCKLLFEFEREFNSIAPRGTRANVD